LPKMVGGSVLYDKLAKYYDQIYHWKDYQKESRTIREIVQSRKSSRGNALLDVACGTGRHIRYLEDEFDCVGIDASEQMLVVARRNAPGASFVRGDMKDFKMEKRFDVVICLFSGIGHLRTRAEVGDALGNFARHMKKGGVLIVEPWLRESKWRDGRVDLQRYESDSLKIARVNFGRREGAFSVIDERYLIAESGKGIEYVKDRLKLRFFELDYALGAMKSVGLKPEFAEDGLMPGRGLLIATS
jgi:ubiquinone/menaquinone biosynthesis C-methylase UbiE